MLAEVGRCCYDVDVYTARRNMLAGNGLGLLARGLQCIMLSTEHHINTTTLLTMLFHN